MLKNIEEGLETFESFLDDLQSSVKREFYRGTVRTLNAIRILTSRGYLTKFESTPAEVIISERNLKLQRYWQDFHSSSYSPILIIPPLMVTPQIYDLRARHSFVRHLLNYDFDVFLLDFGAPTKQDRHLRLEDYLKNIERSIDAIRTVTGVNKVTLLGYCMGGIFCNMFAALDQRRLVKSIVAIATPCDFSRIPKYYDLAKTLEKPLLHLADLLHGIPPSMSRTIFQMSQPVKNLTLPINLMLNLWDEEYVASYESMERWFEDFVAYPRDAFKQFFVDVVRDNKLYRNELQISGRLVDMRQIKVPYLVLAGRQDFIGYPDSVRSVIEVLGSRDKTFAEMNGGHLGVLVGKQATRGWNLIAHWLKQRTQIKYRERRVKSMTDQQVTVKTQHQPKHAKSKTV